MLRQGGLAVNKQRMSRDDPDAKTYALSQQVGYNLRRANQRHVAIFARHVEGLTPTQFAALARIAECGALSQNKLGRMTAMDSATIKGVVERLSSKGLVVSRPDQNDQRLRNVDLTPAGHALFDTALKQALAARAETLEPHTPDEAATVEALLAHSV